MDPYPMGTPGPAPTPTEITEQNRKYDGWTGEEIADDLGVLMVATPAWSSVSTSYVESAEITTDDAERLGLPEDAISYQSPTDMAIILEGSFATPRRGLTTVTPEPVDYLLVVVDTYSGAFRMRAESDSLEELQAMLP
jgi:hypothetical protein